MSIIKKKQRKQTGWEKLAWFVFAVCVISVPFTSPWLKPKSITIEGSQPQDSLQLANSVKKIANKNIWRASKFDLMPYVNSNPRIKDIELKKTLTANLTVYVLYREPEALIFDGRKAILFDSSMVPFSAVNLFVSTESIIDETSKDEKISFENLKPTGDTENPNNTQDNALMATIQKEMHGFAPSPQVIAWSNINKLPVIQIQTPLIIYWGKPTSDHYVMAGFEALKLMKENKIPFLAQIAVDSKGKLCLNMDTDTRVRLGNKEQLGIKLALFSEMLRRSPNLGLNVEYFDLSNPKVPVRKLKNEGQYKQRTETSSP